MPHTILVALVLYALLCLFTGFIACGEGSHSEKYGGILGLIAIVGGLVSIILCVTHEYWLGILLTVIVYLVCLNIGGALMRRLIRRLRRGYEHIH